MWPIQRMDDKRAGAASNVERLDDSQCARTEGLRRDCLAQGTIYVRICEARRLQVAASPLESVLEGGIRIVY